MKTRPCYACGFCCTQSACGYGQWNETKKQCYYLTADNKCAKYNLIVEQEQTQMYAMMGCGCSSPLCNERRNAKMIELGLDPKKEQEEIKNNLGINLDFSPNLAMLWEKMGKVHDQK